MKTKTGRAVHCDEVTKYICENLDEQVNSPRCRAIKKHLQSCAACSKNLADLKKVVLLYRHESIPRLTRSAEKRLFKALKLEL